MDNRRYNMLAIGGFARAARLSIKALRLYDQLGLLKPGYVDPESGYRYYSADQLRVARLIRTMRQMDIPLATIRRVLAAAPVEAEILVQAYWQTRERRMEQARRLLGLLVASLRQEAATMTLEVSVRAADPQPIICISSRVKVDQLDITIRDSLRRLYELVEQRGVGAAGPPFGIYHGSINHDDDGPIEVCVPIAGPIDGADGVVARELPGGTLAWVMLHGDQCAFPAILQGYDAVYDWIRQNGYEPSGAPREIWHSAPGSDARMEIAWPFREPGKD